MSQTTPVPWRRGWRWVAAALLTAAGLLGAAPAQAHDALSGQTPAAGAQVEQLPTEVVLTFDQPALAVGTQIIVTGPDGPVQDGAPRLVDTTVHQPLKTGPAGTYAVSWRVTSADGHPVSGSFDFTTARPSGSAAQTAAPAAGPLASSDPGGGFPVGWVVLLVVLVLLVAGLAWVRSRRHTHTS